MIGQAVKVIGPETQTQQNLFHIAFQVIGIMMMQDVVKVGHAAYEVMVPITFIIGTRGELVVHLF